MAATFISSAYGGPTVLFVLLRGMASLNFISQESQLVAGVAFSSRSILRLGGRLARELRWNRYSGWVGQGWWVLPRFFQSDRQYSSNDCQNTIRDTNAASTSVANII
jgi:hypothetical protein